MRVLWITNILFPDICAKLNRKSPVTGGWMYSSAEQLLFLDKSLELAVAAPYNGTKILIQKINHITYYCLPFPENQIKYNTGDEKVWKIVHDSYRPNIIHIHGTEFVYGLAYMNACGIKNVVVSIQGLVNVYARYSLGQISEDEIRKNRTIYDFLKGGDVLNLPKKMIRQGKLEIEYIQKIHHVIGRTDWDRDHVWAINPKVRYHFCNETLRTKFYMHKWIYERCIPHTIFLSQAYKPIKGIHKIIDAMPYVLREFPDTKVYVAGINFIERTSLKNRLRFDAYANYIYKKIRNLGLIDYFVFTGLLSEQDMIDQYLSSNLFVCPSSIENSPNSLGEAQLLGVPTIAAYVGGIPDMIKDGVSGFMYRFEEHEMLAKKICRIFNDSQLATSCSCKDKSLAN